MRPQPKASSFQPTSLSAPEARLRDRLYPRDGIVKKNIYTWHPIRQAPKKTEAFGNPLRRSCATDSRTTSAELFHHGLLAKDHSLTGVELGNEVSQSAGIVELQDFSLIFAGRE